ncbi:hypothetical protein O0I10_008324 [Lichtheimia ornata]|uniref:Formin GTPase-binding domain-containing protein n=1 Tax=Lichtheimia ornata TaxID=688661 RepID=A0AAD7UZ69_9FUNG|nr:uncharacterized protein O0I10_008324 [Lichtheimia ornata]KAJ8655885.1 hypothetical protein O0I10_008324 [Lichtheimia ornata]
MASPRLLNRVSRFFSISRQPSEMQDEMDGDSMFSYPSSVRDSPSSPPPLRTVRLDVSPETNKEQVDAAFDQLMQEIALASNVRPTLTQLTTEQKSAMLQSSLSLRGGKSSSSNILFGRFDTHHHTHGGGQAPNKTPEQMIRQLQGRKVQRIDEGELMSLRIFLRNGAASWTTEFLDKGGYALLTDLLRQLKEAPKRTSHDDKQLQHLCKCFKTIMTHEPKGTAQVLTHTEPLEHVRDLLFGPSDPKRKALYNLQLATRQQLLALLCTLPTIQTAQPHYVHGYDALRQLLIDRPHDIVESSDSKEPFRMRLKADPETVMRTIAPGVSRPRYTAWMRELQLTVDRHIEPMTYLAQVLDYNFESAFRQLKTRSGNPYEQHQQLDQQQQPTVMVDEGVVDYVISHLRLICTLVTTPATCFRGTYDKYEQEKMRLEIMVSGFDKVAKCLYRCPHPTLYASYIRYLQPLLEPWADITPRHSHNQNSPHTPNDDDDNDDDDDQWTDEDDIVHENSNNSNPML